MKKTVTINEEACFFVKCEKIFSFWNEVLSNNKKSAGFSIYIFWLIPSKCEQETMYVYFSV